MHNRTRSDASEKTDKEDSQSGINERTSSIVDNLEKMARSTTDVVRNLNLVGSLALLAALISIWTDFQGSYTATQAALEEVSPILAALLPAILVALTLFLIIWLTVYGYHCGQYIRAKVAPDLRVRAELKNLVLDIETCLFFTEKAIENNDHTMQSSLKRHVGETCLSLWEDMQSAGLDGPTVYSLGAALGRNDETPDVEEIYRLLKKLEPLARSGKVQEARRIY